MSQGNKVYGLILPKKQGQVKTQSSAVSNIFGNDSDENESSTGPVAPYRVATSSNKMKRQTQMDIDKALMEDPNIYEYDEVYDDMQASKPQIGKKEKEKAKIDKKPKYIAGLLKAAEVKKRDDERRLERKVQKEREAEGEMYADREKFVTSAYKQKMLEMQEEEEREKREAAFEAMTDVTKQKDMSGFYRYLYRHSGETNDATDLTSSAVDTSKEGPNGSEQSCVKEEPPSSQASPQGGVPVKLEQRERSASVSSTSSSASSSKGKSVKATDKVSFTKSSRAVASSNIRQRRRDSSSSSDPEQQKKGGLGSREPKARKSRSKSPQGQVSTEREKDNRRKRRNSRSSPQGTESRRRRSRSPQNIKSRRKSLSPQRVNAKKRSRSPKESQVKRNGGSGSSLVKDRNRSRSRSPSPEERGRHQQRRRTSSSPKDSQAAATKSTSPPTRRDKAGPDRRQVQQRLARDEDHSGKSGDEELHVNTVKPASDSISKNLKGLRESSNVTIKGKSTGGDGKTKPVDPSKKVYPHHNSAEDIKEARKRYLQRRIARERGTAG